jgi:hypothetical protein
LPAPKYPEGHQASYIRRYGEEDYHWPDTELIRPDGKSNEEDWYGFAKSSSIMEFIWVNKDSSMLRAWRIDDRVLIELIGGASMKPLFPTLDWIKVEYTHVLARGDEAQMLVENCRANEWPCKLDNTIGPMSRYEVQGYVPAVAAAGLEYAGAVIRATSLLAENVEDIVDFYASFGIRVNGMHEKI